LTDAGGDDHAPLCVAVAVTTFRRPQLLGELLPMLVEQCVAVRSSDVAPAVLVVDNDPAESARAAVTRAATRSARADVPVRYVVEPHPGISAARNRALSESQDCQFLVFIDDDEQPSPGWLQSLLATQRAHACAGVLGPVIADYRGDVDPWILAGGFFVRPRQATGTTRRIGFTGNLLLDLRVVRRLGLAFDEQFSLTGGEDSLFTAQLTAAGERIVWCDEAPVRDLVPAERATRAWVLKRRFRAGTSHSRVALRLARSPARRGVLRLTLTAHGSARAVVGACRYALGMITGSARHQARGLRTAYRGLGLVAGAWGSRYREYARTH
jgi:glycosyltransferase involved in cell wall biosynthesis